LILLTYVQILPSGHAVAQRHQAGLALAPFRGIRYAEDRVSGLAEVTSPPYDVIAVDKEDQLLAADPHNIVRLILPRHQPGAPGDLYRDAKQTLAQWQRDGILVPDPVPALYVYEQTVPDDCGPDSPAFVQRGLIGALQLTPPEVGIVLPHEDVAPGLVADRQRLMEATQANLEPIFLLYDGSEPGAATRLVDDAAGRRSPLLETFTADGIRHRLWAITDAAELAAIAHAPAPAPPQTPASHRVIAGLHPAAAAQRAGSAFGVRQLTGGTADLTKALAELAAAAKTGPAFLLA